LGENFDVDFSSKGCWWNKASQTNNCDHGGLTKGLRIVFYIYNSKTHLFWGWWGRYIQGTKIGVIKEMNINYALFSITIHCMVHKCNLVFKTLFSLGIMSNIKDLLQTCHFYFAHGPKKHMEFTKLTNMMEIKGLKMLQYMKIQSLLDLLKRILS